MITLTMSGLNFLDLCDCNTVTGHITFVPLGLSSHSFLYLIDLCEVRIFLICCHLAVFTNFLTQREVRIRDISA